MQLHFSTVNYFKRLKIFSIKIWLFVNCWMLNVIQLLLQYVGPPLFYSWDSHANSSHALILDIFLFNQQIFSAGEPLDYQILWHASRSYWYIIHAIGYTEYSIVTRLTNLNMKKELVRSLSGTAGERIETGGKFPLANLYIVGLHCLYTR